MSVPPATDNDARRQTAQAALDLFARDLRLYAGDMPEAGLTRVQELVNAELSKRQKGRGGAQGVTNDSYSRD